MDSRSCKTKKIYVEQPRGTSSFIIHGTGHSSEQCKVLSDSEKKYSAGRTSKKK